MVSALPTDQPIEVLRKFMEKRKEKMSIEKILDNAVNVASAYITNEIGWRKILKVYPADVERL